MKFATWRIPEDISAIKEYDMKERIKFYRFKLKHFLLDGTRVIPTVPTVKCVLDSYDMFELELALSKNSYTLYVEENS